MLALVLFFEILTVAFAKGIIPYCPNSNAPEVDQNGHVIHCLPGADNSCSNGYVCLFSGHNYQCCPSYQYEDVIECPAPMLTVLDSEENPLRCDNATHSCPQSGMQCLIVNSVPLCCQGTSYISGENVIKMEVDREAVVEPQCPANSFAVLDEDLKTVLCNSFNCEKKEQFCYEDAGVSICCETNYEAFDDKSIDKESNDPLKSFLVESDKLVKHINEVTKRPAHGGLNSEESTIITTAETDEATATTKPPLLPETSTVNITATVSSNGTNSISQSFKSEEQLKTVTELAGGSNDKYKPHDFGGYVLSKLGSDTVVPRETKREFARRFLLEQIKRGWPYHEDFYRPIGNNSKF